MLNKLNNKKAGSRPAMNWNFSKITDLLKNPEVH